MRMLFLPLILLAAQSSAALGQATRSEAAFDTITIISASSSPARVRIVNTGALATVVMGLNVVKADTLFLSTPLSLIVPRTKFSLAIVAVPGSGEAQVIITPISPNATMERHFQVTLTTPFRVERLDDEAPLKVESTTMEARRVP